MLHSKHLLVLISILISAVAGNDPLWLRTDPLPDTKLVQQYRAAIQHINCENETSHTSPLISACTELSSALSMILSQDIDLTYGKTNTAGYLTVSASMERGTRTSSSQLADEQFTISSAKDGGLLLDSQTGRGSLFGAYHLISLIRRQILDLSSISITEAPKSPLRIWQLWDNLDGTIERGYAGRSIFHWEELPLLRDRYEDYAKLLASVGINAISLSNVNACFEANIMLLSDEYIAKAAALASVFSKYGVSTFLTPCYSSPMIEGVGDLETADPVDPRVQAWWREKAVDVSVAFSRASNGVTSFGGFLMKADSEGMPGPSTYNRTEPEGAQVLADALAPVDAVLLWRAFSHPGDIEGTSGDQPLMQYQVFTGYDGQWPDNMVLQIKNGPMDFQTHEPVHSLFGQLPQTSVMVELGVTQEYTGQAIHLCHLPAMWESYLRFDTDCETNATLANIVTGRTKSTAGYKSNGFAGVGNFGESPSWTGHPMAAANSYGFGRLSWDPDLSARSVTVEWAILTWGNGSSGDHNEEDNGSGGSGGSGGWNNGGDSSTGINDSQESVNTVEAIDNAEAIKSIVDMLMTSWSSYESVTSPFGLGAVCESCSRNPQYCPYDAKTPGSIVTGPARHDHYFLNLTLWQYADKYCDPDTGVCDGNAGYGGGFNATCTLIGNNRSTAYGATYCGRNALMFSTPESTPEDLLLTFHHVPYGYRLQSGEGLLERIRESTQVGVQTIRAYMRIWEGLRHLVAWEEGRERQWKEVMARLRLAASDAANFSSSVVGYFNETVGRDCR